MRRASAGSSAPPVGGATRRREGRVAVLKRLLLISCGLALAGLAAWAVLDPAGREGGQGEAEIDDSSRARLIEVLDGQEGSGRRGGGP